MDFRSLFIDKDKIVMANMELGVALNSLDEAIVLNQLNYWIERNKDANRNFHDGHYWVYNSYEAWRKQDFPVWSATKIKRIFTSLEGKGIVLSANYNKLAIDKTKWYTIDYDKLKKFIEEYSKGQNETQKDQDEISKDADDQPIGQNDQTLVQSERALPDTNYRDYNINSKANSFFAKKVREHKKVVNQDEFINHIHNVVKQMEEEVFDEYQADNVEQFFIYFIERYAQVFGKRHPFLKEETLYSLAADITEHIYIDRGEFYTNFEPLISDEPEDNSYESVVDLYFETEFKEKCDYSMAHFCQKNVLTKLMGHDSSHLWFTNES